MRNNCLVVPAFGGRVYWTGSRFAGSQSSRVSVAYPFFRTRPEASVKEQKRAWHVHFLSRTAVSIASKHSCLKIQ